MTTYVGLLRAVNLGGASTLLMSDLRRLCEEAGLRAPQTYIASGNVLFDSHLPEAQVKATLEAALAAHAGRTIPCAVRTGPELSQALADDPFPERPRNRVLAVFLDAPPAPDALAGVVAPGDERVALGRREIYIAYGDDMGRSKLRVPAAERGTARNMNTVAKLAALAAARA